ncbi:MAG: glycosyltransferase, partial [Ruminiclostridium sp.]|nr:glycosyltransferase [Ruminiclostridium sp.]MBP3520472.1 glycosyltransferase [Oscillospiraceae bacterium]
MKILMATNGLDIGGAETHIVELAKELRRRGHEILVVSNGGVYVEELEKAGIRHIKAPLNSRSLKPMHRSYQILKKTLREEKPDVVHAHARIPGFLCGRLCRALKRPFVTSCHGVYQAKGALKLLSDWGEYTLAVSDDIRSYLHE